MIDPRTAPYAALILRVTLGVLFLVHAGLKLFVFTPAGTAALSGFTQSVGYLLSAIGPFGMGLLYELSGGWTVPLVALIVLCLPQLVAGLLVSRPSYIEDAIRS